MTTALLLSGGMDSASLLWWKRPDVAFCVDYGQLPAQAEFAASSAICATLGIPLHRIVANCQALGSGDMAGAQPDELAPASDWWPYRNQLLVTLVAMKAIAMRVRRLLIGTVRSDGVHADGTKAFVSSLSDLMKLQEGHLVLEAPAIEMTTLELVATSGIPYEHLSWAHSCHKAEVPCGCCRGCNKYFQTLEALRVEQVNGTR